MNVTIKRNEVKNETPITMSLTMEEARAVATLLGKSEKSFRDVTGIVSTEEIYHGLIDAVNKLGGEYNNYIGINWQLFDRNLIEP
jgi:hypothetical protein